VSHLKNLSDDGNLPKMLAKVKPACFIGDCFGTLLAWKIEILKKEGNYS
jgi:hypothetical protein